MVEKRYASGSDDGFRESNDSSVNGIKLYLGKSSCLGLDSVRLNLQTVDVL